MLMKKIGSILFTEVGIKWVLKFLYHNKFFVLKNKFPFGPKFKRYLKKKEQFVMINLIDSKRFFLNAMAVLVLLLMVRDGFSVTPEGMDRTRIKPTIAEMKAGSEQQFYVVRQPMRLTAAYATNKIVWFVNGFPGGNEKVGTINQDGLYRAPEKPPQSPEIFICAEISKSSNRYLWATVLINGKRPRYETTKEWGEKSDNIKYLNGPKAIAVENTGNILVAAGSLYRFSPDGIFISKLGYSIGDVDAAMEGLLNVTVDEKDNIFVSDTNTGTPRIQVLSPNGVFLYRFGQKGAAPGRVMDTRGMAFDSRRRLYIGEIDNPRVSVFEHSGEFVQTIGKKGVFPGEFNFPYGITLDANDDLFVISYFGPCQKLTSDGRFILNFGHADPPDGPIYFRDIASDSWGNVYIVVKGEAASDGTFKKILDKNGENVDIIKYNNNGDFITNLHLSSRDYEADRIVIDKLGKIYVLYNGEKKVGVEILQEHN
jgi:hypothetical protein